MINTQSNKIVRFSISSIILVLLFLQSEISSAEYGSGENDEGMEVQVYGPIHEAYADVGVNKTLPLAIILKSVPEPINEIPPDDRPGGDRVEWISGYWSWDGGQEDFVWVSGIWREIPPDRKWNSGYWVSTGEGNQYIPGYWAQLNQTEAEYLPPPPEPLNAVSSSPPISPDHEWMKGYWVWNYNYYAWQTGYWYEHRPSMVWVSAHYVWTPRGYIFVSGYWDYPFANRGVMYAPIHYVRPIYRNYDYYYTPHIALDFDTVFLSLFVRRGGHHYYFGDYHHVRYAKRGFYPWYSKHATRYGHDPHYKSYRFYRQRYDKQWESKYHRKFKQRRNKSKAWMEPKYHKDRNFGQSYDPIKKTHDRKYANGAKNNGRALQPHRLKKYQNGKIRLHDQKSKRRAVKPKNLKKVTTKERKLGKNTVTKKRLQHKKSTPPARGLKSQSNRRWPTDLLENRSQPVQVKYLKTERKRSIKSQERRKSKRVQIQEKKSQKPAYTQKNGRQKTSAASDKIQNREATVSKKSGKNRPDRHRGKSLGQNSSRQRFGMQRS